jgi:hypothetical protein
MTLARLLLARGDAREAIRIAAWMDRPQAVVNLLYLRPSLTLRAAAADSLGDRALAARMRARLAALGGGSTPSPSRAGGH